MGRLLRCAARVVRNRFTYSDRNSPGVEPAITSLDDLLKANERHRQDVSLGLLREQADSRAKRLQPSVSRPVTFGEDDHGIAAIERPSRVLEAAARILGVDQQRLSELAMSAPAGADGLVLLPYLEGERTPNLPDATGELHGLRHKTSTPVHLARAAVEGVLCGLADAIDAIEARGVEVERVHLIGGGSRSEALRAIAPTVFGRPVQVPPPAEYVADGAAFQAHWALDGGKKPTAWIWEGSQLFEAEPVPAVRARYAEVRDEYISGARRAQS